MNSAILRVLLRLMRRDSPRVDLFPPETAEEKKWREIGARVTGAHVVDISRHGR